MKSKLKLWARRLALRLARKLVDLADDRLHAAEVRYREEVNAVPEVQTWFAGSDILKSGDPRPQQRCRDRKPNLVRRTGQGLPAERAPETFSQWEARRSGVAVITKKEARHRRAVSAAAFDLRFSER